MRPQKKKVVIPLVTIVDGPHQIKTDLWSKNTIQPVNKPYQLQNLKNFNLKLFLNVKLFRNSHPLLEYRGFTTEI